MRTLSCQEIQSVSGGATTGAAPNSIASSPILSLIALPFVALFATVFFSASGSNISYFDVLRQGFDAIFPKT